jgi:hypothetical protein
MGKYDPLREHLKAAPQPARMTFEQIEGIVGRLPPSAYEHRAWWANSRSHPNAVAWLDAGRLVDEVSLERGYVVFSKTPASGAVAAPPAPEVTDDSRGKTRLVSGPDRPGHDIDLEASGRQRLAAGDMPGHPVTEEELTALGFLPLALEMLGTVQLLTGVGTNWNTTGHIPDAPGHYLFTVEDGEHMSVAYVGLTSHLSMVTKGTMPGTGGRGGQRYGRPKHAGVTRKRVNTLVTEQLQLGRVVRHWVRAMPRSATLSETSRLLLSEEELLIRGWRLRELGWNRG